MIIRPVTSDDIEVLSEYWYDNMALLQQYHPHMKLLPDARYVWEQSAHAWLKDEHMLSLACEITAGETVGCIVGRLAENAPGLVPGMIGTVDYLVLDIHSPHKMRGVGNALLSELRRAFTEHGIFHLQVSVPIGAVVAQAFWRGVGASKINDVFWIE